MDKLGRWIMIMTRAEFHISKGKLPVEKVDIKLRICKWKSTNERDDETFTCNRVLETRMQVCKLVRWIKESFLSDLKDLIATMSECKWKAKGQMTLQSGLGVPIARKKWSGKWKLAIGSPKPKCKYSKDSKLVVHLCILAVGYWKCERKCLFMQVENRWRNNDLRLGICDLNASV